MDIYITGKVENKDGQDVLMSAIAMDGKLLKLETPFEGEQTYHDVVYKVMRKTEDYIKHLPIIQQMGTRHVDFYTDYLGSGIHDAINQSYKDEKIYACRESLAELLHTPSIKVDSLYISEVKDVLMQRVFEPKTEQTYHFKPDDLIANHGNFSRVVSVDKANDKVQLDLYLGYGEVSSNSGNYRLLETELMHYYRPMTDEEILTFHDNLTALLAKPKWQQKLKDRDTTMQTYEIVSKAVENIRAAEKADDLDLEL